MAPAKKSILSHGKYREKKYDSLFREWHGGADSSVHHLPGAESIADVMSSLTKKLVPPWQQKLDLIVNNWTGLVGEMTAKKVTPLKIAENRVLLLELRHPAYRMAFDTPAVKKALLEKITALAGEKICTEIRFVAAGMFAPAGKKS